MLPIIDSRITNTMALSRVILTDRWHFWGKLQFFWINKRIRRSKVWGISNRKLGFNDRKMLDKTRLRISSITNGIFNCFWPILDQMSGLWDSETLPSYFSFNEVRHTDPRIKIRLRFLSPFSRTQPRLNTRAVGSGLQLHFMLWYFIRKRPLLELPNLFSCTIQKDK